MNTLILNKNIKHNISCSHIIPVDGTSYVVMAVINKLFLISQKKDKENWECRIQYNMESF